MSIQIGFENLPAPILSHLRDAVSIRYARPHIYHVTELIRCLRHAWYKRTYPERVRGGSDGGGTAFLLFIRLESFFSSETGGNGGNGTTKRISLTSYTKTDSPPNI